jgi:multidrug efflux pump subunit AcrA (membrane-fusion protein)
VYVVDAENKAQVRAVKIEPEDEGTVVVREGLANGERVVLEGQVRLAPGVPVEIRAQ